MWPYTHGILMPAAYTPGAVEFDGTNDVMSRSTDFTGNAASQVGTLSFWYLPSTGSGFTEYVYASTGAGGVINYVAQLAASSALELLFLSSTGGTVVNLGSTVLVTSTGGWRHIAAAFDMASTGKSHLYIDGVDAKSSTSSQSTALTCAWAQNGHHVGGVDAASTGNRLAGRLADFYLNTAAFIDISASSNLLLFRSAAGKPVDLGSSGQTPTGSAPTFFFTHVAGATASDFATNRAGNGNMTITGALTESTSSPSD